MLLVLKRTIIDGVSSETVNEYEDWLQAKHDFHDALSTAYATSKISYVLVMLINEEGNVDMKENCTIVDLSYDANGGSGTISPVRAMYGYPVGLNDGSSLTAPSGKVFAGWATSASATEPNVSSPFPVFEDTTLYAVWVDET